MSQHDRLRMRAIFEEMRRLERTGGWTREAFECLSYTAAEVAHVLLDGPVEFPLTEQPLGCLQRRFAIDGHDFRGSLANDAGSDLIRWYQTALTAA